MDLIIFFIVLLVILHLFNKRMQRDEEEMVEQYIQAAKQINASFVVEVEVVDYQGEKIYLGNDAMTRKFLGQGMSEEEMLSNVFKRFPNKERIVYGYQDSKDPVKIALKESYV